MWEARPRGDYVQDERYVASEHMDVRRDSVTVAPDLTRIAARTRLPQLALIIMDQ